MSSLQSVMASLRPLIQQEFDAMISEWGKDCTLVFPPRPVDCANCEYDPIGQKSSNVYTHGGPVPFPDMTICPVCQGQGRIFQSQESVIKMLVNWEPKQYRDLQIENIRTPDGIIETKGFVSDIPKIKRATHIIIQKDLEGIISYKFKLWGEPGDLHKLIHGRYFTTLWQRQG